MYQGSVGERLGIRKKNASYLWSIGTCCPIRAGAGRGIPSKQTGHVRGTLESVRNFACRMQTVPHKGAGHKRKAEKEIVIGGRGVAETCLSFQAKGTVNAPAVGGEPQRAEGNSGNTVT